MSARRSLPRTETNRSAASKPAKDYAQTNFSDYTYGRVYQGGGTDSVNQGISGKLSNDERKRILLHEQRAQQQSVSPPRSMYVPPPIFDSDNEDYPYPSRRTGPITQRRSVATHSSPSAYKKYLPNSERYRARETGPDWMKVAIRHMHRYLQQTFKYLKDLLVSYGLICIFIILVLGIIIVYNNKSANRLTGLSTNTIEKSNIIYKPCDELPEMNTLVEPSYNCIEREKLDFTIAIAKELLQLLQMKAERHNCEDSNQPNDVYILEFMKYLHRKAMPVDMFQMQALEYLLKQNKQWTIEILGAKGAPDSISNRMGKPTLKEDIHFVLLKPQLPFKCQMRKKFLQFFVIVGTAALILLAGVITYMVIKNVRNRRRERYASIHNFIEQIIDEVSSQPDKEFVVNHLRDQLIPIKGRQSKLWSWTEALRVLEVCDSRIQFGMFIHNGEECRKIRWIGNTINEPNNAKNNKSKHSRSLD